VTWRKRKEEEEEQEQQERVNQYLNCSEEQI